MELSSAEDEAGAIGGVCLNDARVVTGDHYMDDEPLIDSPPIERDYALVYLDNCGRWMTFLDFKSPLSPRALLGQLVVAPVADQL